MIYESFYDDIASEYKQSSEGQARLPWPNGRVLSIVKHKLGEMALSALKSGDYAALSYIASDASLKAIEELFDSLNDIDIYQDEYSTLHGNAFHSIGFSLVSQAGLDSHNIKLTPDMFEFIKRTFTSIGDPITFACISKLSEESAQEVIKKHKFHPLVLSASHFNEKDITALYAANCQLNGSQGTVLAHDKLSESMILNPIFTGMSKVGSYQHSDAEKRAHWVLDERRHSYYSQHPILLTIAAVAKNSLLNLHLVTDYFPEETVGSSLDFATIDAQSNLKTRLYDVIASAGMPLSEFISPPWQNSTRFDEPSGSYQRWKTELATLDDIHALTDLLGKCVIDSVYIDENQNGRKVIGNIVYLAHMLNAYADKINAIAKSVGQNDLPRFLSSFNAQYQRLRYDGDALDYTAIPSLSDLLSNALNDFSSHSYDTLTILEDFISVAPARVVFDGINAVTDKAGFIMAMECLHSRYSLETERDAFYIKPDFYAERLVDLYARAELLEPKFNDKHSIEKALEAIPLNKERVLHDFAFRVNEDKSRALADVSPQQPFHDMSFLNPGGF